ncbi:MAG: vancomycin resistance protein VanJ [Flavobacteriales bacterium]|jgi:vancomycin resistance protein VanJ
MPKRVSFFGKLLFWLNNLSTLALLLSHYFVHIHPGNYYIAGLIAMSYPLWLLINICFFLYWVYRFKKYFLLPLFGFILTWSSIGNLYQGLGNSKDLNPNESLRILSYNVRLFNLYNWIDEDGIDLKQINLINEQNADIVGIQEYYKKNDNIHLLQFPYKKVKLINPNKNYGLAIYSKYPILNSYLISNVNNSANAIMRSDIRVDSDTIRVFNAHLASLKLGARDYAFLDNINKEKTEEELKVGTLKILGNMRKAYKSRTFQIDVLKREIANSPYPIVLLGDFNDVPQSYVYHSLTENLNDAFIESGSGFGKTYTRYLPSFRIDYILHHSQWDAFNYKVLNEQELSDHYPVRADLILN